MRRPAVGLVAAATFAAVTIAPTFPAASAAKDADRPSPVQGFEAVQEAAAKANAERLAVLLPADLVKDRSQWTDAKTTAWREGWTKRLASLKAVGSAGLGDGKAHVRCADAAAGEELVVPLAWKKDAWVVTAGDPWLVKGKALDAVRAGGPGKVHLAPRTSNDGYGKSAFSFAHATGDPEQCWNRMDVWYCRSKWLHSGHDSTLALLPRADFAKLEGIPADVTWSDEVKPAVGNVVLVHCFDRRHRDFYVKAKVVAAGPKGLDLEWTLLAAGFGSPAGVTRPSPYVGRDAADGYEGICAPH